MASELWQAKYNNVFTRDLDFENELIQRTLMLLDRLEADECTPYLLVHLGMIPPHMANWFRR